MAKIRFPDAKAVELLQRLFDTLPIGPVQMDTAYDTTDGKPCLFPSGRTCWAAW